MELIAIIGICFSILLYGFVIYNILIILLFFFFWEKEPAQKLLKSDSEYGDAITSFLCFEHFIFTRNPVRKISLYSEFMLISDIFRKNIVNKALDKIYFTGDIPWWHSFWLMFFKIKILRVKYKNKTCDYLVTDKQAKVIYSWLQRKT